jgi:hypothetical protein
MLVTLGQLLFSPVSPLQKRDNDNIHHRLSIDQGDLSDALEPSTLPSPMGM